MGNPEESIALENPKANRIRQPTLEDHESDSGAVTTDRASAPFFTNSRHTFLGSKF